jgi:hypothetical protein
VGYVGLWLYKPLDLGTRIRKDKTHNNNASPTLPNRRRHPRPCGTGREATSRPYTYTHNDEHGVVVVLLLLLLLLLLLDRGNKDVHTPPLKQAHSVGVDVAHSPSDSVRQYRQVGVGAPPRGARGGGAGATAAVGCGIALAFTLKLCVSARPAN